MGRDAKPYHRKHDGWWYATLAPGAPPQRLFKGVPSQKNRKLATEIFERRRRSTSASLDHAECFRLVEEFLEHTQINGKPNTYRNYSEHLNHFTARCGKVRCRQLTLAHATKIINHHKKKKPKRIKRTITISKGKHMGQKRKHISTQRPWGANYEATFIKILKTCFIWGTDQGYIFENPFRKLKTARFKPSRTVIISKDDLEQIMAETTPVFRQFVFALRHTGCRPSEVASVTAGHVDTNLWRWVFTEHKTDGKIEERIVWLDDEMIELTKRLVELYPEGSLFRNTLDKPWSRNAISQAFGRARMKLGIDDGAVPYAVRHTFITEGLTNGVPTATIACRHLYRASPVKTTMLRGSRYWESLEPSLTFVNSIMQPEPSEIEAIVLSKHGSQSTWGEIPWPEVYSLMIS